MCYVALFIELIGVFILFVLISYGLRMRFHPLPFFFSMNGNRISRVSVPKEKEEISYVD